jgi:3-dehydroquinate synthase
VADITLLSVPIAVRNGILAEVGSTLPSLALPPGELQKNLAMAGKLYDQMARFGMDRKSILIAVGGGVITDLGGFVASTYMHGISLALVPTTLLGQVDAAIGGKTAVNLPHGKNLVGTFHQPCAVFCDPETLRTLPEAVGRVRWGVEVPAALITAALRTITAP